MFPPATYALVLCVCLEARQRQAHRQLVWHCVLCASLDAERLQVALDLLVGELAAGTVDGAAAVGADEIGLVAVGQHDHLIAHPLDQEGLELTLLELRLAKGEVGDCSDAADCPGLPRAWAGTAQLAPGGTVLLQPIQLPRLPSWVGDASSWEGCKAAPCVGQPGQPRLPRENVTALCGSGEDVEATRFWQPWLRGGLEAVLLCAKLQREGRR